MTLPRTQSITDVALRFGRAMLHLVEQDLERELRGADGGYCDGLNAAIVLVTERIAAIDAELADR